MSIVRYIISVFCIHNPLLSLLSPQSAAHRISELNLFLYLRISGVSLGGRVLVGLTFTMDPFLTSIFSCSNLEPEHGAKEIHYFLKDNTSQGNLVQGTRNKSLWRWRCLKSFWLTSDRHVIPCTSWWMVHAQIHKGGEGGLARGFN